MLYEPAEDSFLLAKHIDFSNKKVLDMGTGSGILAKKALEMKNEVTAVDINPEAIDNLKSFPEIKAINSDLFEKVEGKFDVILFNAPYLPTQEEDVIWDGGSDGREVIKRFSLQFGNHLNEGGIALLLISSITGLEETLNLFKGAEIIDSEKVPWETLYVIKIRGS